MKKFAIVCIMCLLAGNLFAGEENQQALADSTGLSRFFSITGGYVPKREYNALKVTADYNNFLFNRFGVYTSFEKGLDSGYFSNIYGITGSLGKRMYLFTGVDLFTHHGLFNARKHCRKDIGIGIIPLKNLLVKMGWSTAVNVTVEVGWKISL